MALSTCEDCGKDVSSLAPFCPHCGRPTNISGQTDTAAPSLIPEARVACPDGNCTGMIGKSGHCRTCGKKSTWSPEDEEEFVDEDGWDIVVNTNNKGDDWPLQLIMLIVAGLLFAGGYFTYKHFAPSVPEEVYASSASAVTSSPARYTPATTYCQNVNNSMTVVNAGQMAKVTNRHMAKNGINYKTSEGEVSRTILKFCKEHPEATADDAATLMTNIVGAMSALGV